MANLRIRSINIPGNTDKWLIRISHERRLLNSGWLRPDEVAQFNVPADWEFPAGFDAWAFNRAQRTKVRLQNRWSHADGYTDCPGVPGLGNQTFDWAARRFVPPVVFQPWVLLVLVLIVIGIVLVAKKK